MSKASYDCKRNYIFNLWKELSENKKGKNNDKIYKRILTDGDITIERVANRLKLISEGIKNSNKLNLCDINVICEEIFGKILNTLYGYELVTIGVQGKPHYVAIDLVDKKNKVAYQVTSTVRRSKIEGTTEKFVKNKLYKDIDELYILILNDDPHKYRNDNNEIDIKTTKKFTIKINYWDRNKK